MACVWWFVSLFLLRTFPVATPLLLRCYSEATP